MAKKAAASSRKAPKGHNGYDAFKEFNGRLYTGMRIGRGHTWHYDAGIWKETKTTPDLWRVHFAVTKRRAGHAPEGSGVPVGTEYHWLIVAHQVVKKLNANDYSTTLDGSKFKIPHKRADRGGWSVSVKGQRTRTIRFLEELLAAAKRGAEDVVLPLPPQQEAPAPPVRIRAGAAAERPKRTRAVPVRKRAPAKRGTVRVG